MLVLLCKQEGFFSFCHTKINLAANLQIFAALYCCFGCISPAADAAPKMVICQAGSVEVNTRTEKWCDTADEILEYMVGGDRLRDVITQVKVWERTIEYSVAAKPSVRKNGNHLSG